MVIQFSRVFSSGSRQTFPRQIRCIPWGISHRYLCTSRVFREQTLAKPVKLASHFKAESCPTSRNNRSQLSDVYSFFFLEGRGRKRKKGKSKTFGEIDKYRSAQVFFIAKLDKIDRYPGSTILGSIYNRYGYYKSNGNWRAEKIVEIVRHSCASCYTAGCKSRFIPIRLIQSIDQTFCVCPRRTCSPRRSITRRIDSKIISRAIIIFHGALFDAINHGRGDCVERSRRSSSNGTSFFFFFRISTRSSFRRE